jgi:hypothetical protein
MRPTVSLLQSINPATVDPNDVGRKRESRKGESFPKDSSIEMPSPVLQAIP